LLTGLTIVIDAVMIMVLVSEEVYFHYKLGTRVPQCLHVLGTDLPPFYGEIAIYVSMLQR
jgi:hypothetical protein